MATKKKIKAAPEKVTRRINPHKTELALLAQHARLYGNGYAVFDLDGCVSGDAWRLGHINNDPGVMGDAKYDYYHSLMEGDAVLQRGGELLANFIGKGITPIFITARPEKWRSVTANWLRDRFGIIASGKQSRKRSAFLLMRKNNDKRDAVMMKEQALAGALREVEKSFQTGRGIVAAFDDRQDIAERYFQYGVRSYVLDYNKMQAIGIVTPFDHEVIHQYLLNEEAAKQPVDAEDTDFALKVDEPVTVENLSEKFAQEEHPPHASMLAITGAMGQLATRLGKYGQSDERAAHAMKVLFPHGFVAQSPEDIRITGLMSTLLAHLTRFADSGLKLSAAIREVAVTAALIEPYCETSDVGVNFTTRDAE